MVRSSRSWSSRTTRGSSVCSFIRNCALAPRDRIHCSPASSLQRRQPSVARRRPRLAGRWSKPRIDMVRGFPRDALFLIAGPCVLEDDNLNLRVGEALARLADRVPGGVYYKASFDKANRSNAAAHRGPGLDEGLEKLARVRSATGLRILTDVHLPEQCTPVAQVVDVLQIPAFLCRQTDLLEAAGATGKAVNVKKGQWMAPEAMKGAVDKIQQSRPPAPSPSTAGSTSRATNQEATVAVTERGSFFGYGDLVVDMRSMTRMKAATGCPVVFDGTHSVQRPGLG